DPRFANKRTEIFWLTKEWLEAGGALWDSHDIVRELSAPTYSTDNPRGLFTLEPKDKTKERIGASPDLADALAVTFAYPVAPRMASRIIADSYIAPQQQGAVYNPLG